MKMKDKSTSNLDVTEIQSFVKVWIVALTSLCYCYFVVKRIPSGFTRLLSVLPIIYLFIILPFNISSALLVGPTAFYLVWLGNFKLFLFSFNRGPLASAQSSLHFISIALLPIKPISDSTFHSPAAAKSKTSSLVDSPPSIQTSRKELYCSPDLDAIGQRWDFKIFKAALFSIKVAILSAILWVYGYREYVHPGIIMALYCCHIYLGVELAMAVSAAPVRVILGIEIEPLFNEPYLASSLQDFWGRRWNLMVTSILRPTVYDPIRSITTPMFGRHWNMVPAILAAFSVSGLMHEIIYYYLCRASPTWEVTSFFVLHGICLIVEVAVKKWLNGRWLLRRAVSAPLTIGFVGVTGVWLFFPQLIRNGVDRKAIDEYSMFARFLRDSFKQITSDQNLV